MLKPGEILRILNNKPITDIEELEKLENLLNEYKYVTSVLHHKIQLMTQPRKQVNNRLKTAHNSTLPKIANN